jgi:hypothetical protein
VACLPVLENGAVAGHDRRAAAAVAGVVEVVLLWRAGACRSGQADRGQRRRETSALASAQRGASCDWGTAAGQSLLRCTGCRRALQAPRPRRASAAGL